MASTLVMSFLLLVALIVLTLAFQFVRNFKVVGANQVAIVAGKGPHGYRTYHGGRVVVWPLINKRYDLDLRPSTTSVEVQSAIAKGMVPLDVTATVSFAVSSSGKVLQNAIRRILSIAQDRAELIQVTSSIVEGHLRDSIATMTPEQVMRDKDQLVRNMIRVCKEDLEAIGLEITTMNIADVEDHRLSGMGDGELYIGLLNRTQSASAKSQARCSQAEAHATSREQAEARRGEVECRKRDNERESLETSTSAKVADERQRGAVGIERAKRDGSANEAGVRAQIAAEKQRIAYLTAQYEAEIVTPAHGKSDRRRLEAEQEAFEIRGVADAEIEQLAKTIEILNRGGASALEAYLIDNFDAFIRPFAQTLNLFPASQVSVLTGVGGEHAPISAVDPHPIERQKADLIRQAFGNADVAGAWAEGNVGRPSQQD
ncbi:SPFH domain-containing protein [Salinisphaera sp. T5B8]|uniref:SPFH domain-containing protein n=1 Tax=Salinisphaera sp. T5B8 TaxID=1304154 RepID=UPI00334084C4